MRDEVLLEPFTCHGLDLRESFECQHWLILSLCGLVRARISLSILTRDLLECSTEPLYTLRLRDGRAERNMPRDESIQGEVLIHPRVQRSLYVIRVELLTLAFILCVRQSSHEGAPGLAPRCVGELAELLLLLRSKNSPHHTSLS